MGTNSCYWQRVCVVVVAGGGATTGPDASAVTVTVTSFEIRNVPHEGNVTQTT